MSAKDKATGKDQSITIAASSGLSDKEIESMLSEAEANRERDSERKAVIEAANSADSVCAETTKAMDEFKDAIDASEKEKITALMTELRELAMKGQAGDGAVTADVRRRPRRSCADACRPSGRRSTRPSRLRSRSSSRSTRRCEGAKTVGLD